jgi:hypothetical protein
VTRLSLLFVAHLSLHVAEGADEAEHLLEPPLEVQPSSALCIAQGRWSRAPASQGTQPNRPPSPQHRTRARARAHTHTHTQTRITNERMHALTHKP